MFKSREIELIPHFGSKKVPRRWMKPFRGFEEIKPNDSGEFTSPIRIDYAEPKCELLKRGCLSSSCANDNAVDRSGPMVLPASLSTGS